MNRRGGSCGALSRSAACCRLLPLAAACCRSWCWRYRKKPKNYANLKMFYRSKDENMRYLKDRNTIYYIFAFFAAAIGSKTNLTEYFNISPYTLIFISSLFFIIPFSILRFQNRRKNRTEK
jgi:hypothetical protein